MIYKQIFSKLQTRLYGCYRLCVSHKFKLVPQLLLVYCATTEAQQKIQISSPDQFTHGFLLKQSSGAAVTAVAQLLHQTVSAYIDVANNYKKALNKQMSLTEDFLNKIGDSFAEEELSEWMVQCRAEVKKLKEEFVQIESLLIYIEDMVNSSAQASFLAGAEYLSLTLSEQLVSAKHQIQITKRDVETTELDYLTTEREAIEKERKAKDKSQGDNTFLK